MLAPTRPQRCWNVADEPVKWMPASARSASSTSEISRPPPVSRLITPGGIPASSSSRIVRCAASPCVGRGLPDHRVAHERGGGGQVAGDRGEVERGDRVDEALERAVVHPVPGARATGRLVLQDLASVRHVEAPEVGQLAGRVDLGLVAGLRLAEHRGGVEPVAPRPGQQVGRAQQHRCALVERQRTPRRSGPERGLDGGLGVLVTGVGRGAQDVGVVVRGDDVDARAGRHVLAAVDRHRQLVVLAGQLGQGRLQVGPLGGARGVVPHRLVARGRCGGDSIHGADPRKSRARSVRPSG